MKQSITSWHYSRLTNTILYLRPPQSVSFLLQLPHNILLLISEQKRALPTFPLTLHPRPTRAVLPPCPTWPLKHPSRIPLNIPLIFSKHTHMTSPSNILPQFQILHQLTLPELKPLYCQKIIQLSYQQNNLYPFLVLIQKSTLPVDITQDCLIYSHMRFQQKNLPHFLLLNQMSTLPGHIPEILHIYSHIAYQWRRLYQLYHLHQVTLPVDIPPLPHQNKHQSNPLMFPLPNNSPQVFHRHSIIRTH